VKSFKTIVFIFVIIFFNGCIQNYKYIEQYSNDDKLTKNSLIAVSIVKDRYFSFLDEFIILELENIQTNEKFKFSNKICHKKLGLLTRMFIEEKKNHIFTKKICGNLFIGELKSGQYKINSIVIKTYDDKGLLITNKKYEVGYKNIISLKSNNEVVYLGSVFIRPLRVNLKGTILELEMAIFDNFNKDKQILQDKYNLKEKFQLINKSIILPLKKIK